jgi:hypothetical protein
MAMCISASTLPVRPCSTRERLPGQPAPWRRQSSSGGSGSGCGCVGVGAARAHRRPRTTVAAAAAGKPTAAKGFGAPKPGSAAAAKAPKSCPCGSGKSYDACCGRLHAGAPAPDPEALLRARFSAYKLQLADYLVATTHRVRRPRWRV